MIVIRKIKGKWTLAEHSTGGTIERDLIAAQALAKRRAKIRRFRDGDTEFLGSAEALGRGFDVPEGTCIEIRFPPGVRA